MAYTRAGCRSESENRIFRQLFRVIGLIAGGLVHRNSGVDLGRVSKATLLSIRKFGTHSPAIVDNGIGIYAPNNA